MQVVFLHLDCNASDPVCLATYNLSNHAADIRNGHLAVQVSVNPATKYSQSSNNHAGCGNGTSCSGSTVAGLVFYAVFSYLWTSQVIGNVALATLAGGAYGSEPSLKFDCCRYLIYVLQIGTTLDLEIKDRWRVFCSMCTWRYSYVNL